MAKSSRDFEVVTEAYRQYSHLTYLHSPQEVTVGADENTKVGLRGDGISHKLDKSNRTFANHL